MPLSLRPAARFNMLSVRSPTIESAATATQVMTNGHGVHVEQPFRGSPGDECRSPTTPPSAPSQVFLGDTRGASGTRPNHRPAKNAPVSAAHTSASVNSTQRVLCVVNVTCTSASQQGTSDRNPASAAVTGVTRPGARHSHRNATNHHTTATVTTMRTKPGYDE